MADPLKFLLPLADAQVPIVADHMINTWPSSVRQQMFALGLLNETESADMILCPECQDHYEEVICSEGPNGENRFFVECPELLRVRIEPKELLQWRLDLNSLVQLLATTFTLSGTPVELVADRLWRLGRITWRSNSRDMLFARGLHWDDGSELKSKLVRSRKPIVVVPSVCLPDEFWRTIPPQIVLKEVAMMVDGKIEIEALEIAACIEDSDSRARNGEPLMLTLDELKTAIRRQIKAEKQTELTDDVFKAAFRKCGSLRSAAEFLSKETGQLVSKDRVSRAIDRAGGIQSVLNAEDSDSIIRGVASQDRDKNGKTLIRSKRA